MEKPERDSSNIMHIVVKVIINQPEQCDHPKKPATIRLDVCKTNYIRATTVSIWIMAHTKTGWRLLYIYQSTSMEWSDGADCTPSHGLSLGYCCIDRLLVWWRYLHASYTALWPHAFGELSFSANAALCVLDFGLPRLNDLLSISDHVRPTAAFSRWHYY